MKTFIYIKRRLRETRKLGLKNNTGQPRSAKTVEAEKQILNIVEQIPTVSTRQIALGSGNWQSTVLREQ